MECVGGQTEIIGSSCEKAAKDSFPKWASTVAAAPATLAAGRRYRGLHDLVLHDGDPTAVQLFKQRGVIAAISKRLSAPPSAPPAPRGDAASARTPARAAPPEGVVESPAASAGARERAPAPLLSRSLAFAFAIVVLRAFALAVASYSFFRACFGFSPMLMGVIACLCMAAPTLDGVRVRCARPSATPRLCRG